MDWFDKNDDSMCLITAKNHLKSGHKELEHENLPQNAMIFCIGAWEKIITNVFDCEILFENLPRFLSETRVYKIKGKPDWCFLHGGHGAPMIADTLETIKELGVKNTILVGMVGGFGEDIELGDLIFPDKIASEEGTSLHYSKRRNFFKLQNNYDFNCLKKYFMKNGFVIKNQNTVTTDAVYRQTVKKEIKWRDAGCVGVDMEGSAFACVCEYLKINSTAVFFVSDKHSIDENFADWKWGIDKKQLKYKFLEHCVKFFADE